MKNRKFAVIDIGSNSVRLMLLADGKILYKRTQITRLGEGVAKTGELQPPAMQRTAAQIEAFAQEARAAQVDKMYAYATAAVRKATNGADFVKEMAKKGVEIEVLSGEEEARVGIVGALGDDDGALLDIGGASSELILRQAQKTAFEISVDVGVVALKDICGRDRQTLTEYCRQKVAQYFGAKAYIATLPLYAIGGTATTLAAIALGLDKYDGDKVTGTVLTIQQIKDLTDKLFSLSVQEIASMPCVDEKRAEVIAGGALWLYEIATYLSVDRVTVSDSDNLDGFAKIKGLL